MCKDNHEKPNRMRECEGNGFSTSLEGLVCTNAQNPSKPVEKPYLQNILDLMGLMSIQLIRSNYNVNPNTKYWNYIEYRIKCSNYSRIRFIHSNYNKLRIKTSN